MLSNTKILSSVIYESQIDEVLLVRGGLVKAQETGNELTESFRKAILAEKMNCWKTDDLNGKDFPFCIDSTNMRDYSQSPDPYRQMLGKSVGIFHARKVVNLDFSEFKVWAKETTKQVSEIATQITLLNSLKDKNFAKFDNDSITYLGNSKDGIFVRNFFDYKGPSTYTKIKKADCYDNIY